MEVMRWMDDVERMEQDAWDGVEYSQSMGWMDGWIRSIGWNGMGLGG